MRPPSPQLGFPPFTNNHYWSLKSKNYRKRFFHWCNTWDEDKQIMNSSGLRVLSKDFPRTVNESPWKIQSLTPQLSLVRIQEYC